jgi:hypothetical protein
LLDKSSPCYYKISITYLIVQQTQKEATNILFHKRISLEAGIRVSVCLDRNHAACRAYHDLFENPTR